MSIAIRKSFLEGTPYTQGEGTAGGANRIIKLSSNESPYPPSPRAIDAFRKTESALGRYPDGTQASLRARIAEIHNIPVGNVFAGNGSEEAIGLIVRTILSTGDEIVVSANSFMMTEIYARSVGATTVAAPEKDFRVDVKALAAAVTEKTKIVYLCSPNNPTGTYTTDSELKWLEATLPQGVLLLVDSAYAEFTARDDYGRASALFSPEGRVAVTHTFSKAYGLAALRIGWAAVPDDIIGAISYLRTPFNTNAAALAAAEAALLDQDHLRQTVSRIVTIRHRFVTELERLGLVVVPSQANFVLIVFEQDTDSAKSLDKALRAAGILGRQVSGHAPELRISIGTQEDMSKTAAVIRTWVESGG